MQFLLLISIVFFLWKDSYISKRDKYIVTACVAGAIVLNIDEMWYEYLSKPENRHLIQARVIQSFIGYIGRPLLLWGLWELMGGRKNKVIRRIFAFLAIGNILIFSTCFFTRLTFYFDPVTYNWGRGPLGMTAHIVMILMMLLFIPVLYDMLKQSKKSDLLAGCILLFIVLISVISDTYYSTDTITEVITVECVLYFLFLHMSMEKEYARAMLSAQKAEMMLMQIKPHFINNTLSTIQALCEIDPPLAARTTGNFARYLRVNLATMDKSLPIPIEEELEHTRTYLEIEMLRFPWIEAEYDIQDTNVCVPALTIQPLAENAIQHGLRKQKNGKIIISTRLTEEGHQIQIIDNGVGFDKNNPVTEKDHGVGLKNVKYRIENVSHGRMLVESNEGVGTTITIYIP